MKESIGDFLLRRLEEAGVRHIFGVPRDYNLDAIRFGISRQIMVLAERFQMQVATLNCAKGAVPETAPQFVGTYAGRGAHPQRAKEAIVLTIGFRRVETRGFVPPPLPVVLALRSRNRRARDRADTVSEMVTPLL